MSEEIKPLEESGEAEVSIDVVAVAPSTVALQEPTASAVMIACKQCGAPFERRG